MRKTSLEMVHRLARKDKRVLFIGSDLGAGVLDQMREEMPERWIMEGVSEQHIVGMAAGLAMEGFIPYVNTIATFLTRRCYEQLVIDVGLHCVPVRLIGNGGGLVYAPLGPTHQAIEDIGIMRMIPNMTVVAPCDAREMERLMAASIDWPFPIYIRLAKGGDEVISNAQVTFEIGKAIVMREPGEVLIVSTGVMTQRALKAATTLAEKGISTGVLHMHTLKPIDDATLASCMKPCSLVVTLEEHRVDGGLGAAILDAMVRLKVIGQQRVMMRGLRDRFQTEYGSQDNLIHSARLAEVHLVEDIQNELSDNVRA